MRVSIFLIALVFVAQTAHAQSSQYQKPGKKKKADAAIAASPVPGTSDAKKSDTKSEKVDINQIEQQYWQQKDTEFHVVQSRRYTKEKKWFVSASYGLLLNDSFNRGNILGLSGGYYFKEQMGIEAFYMDFDAKNSKTINEIFDLKGGPTYSHPLREYGVTFNWMPIYGKISVLDKSIIYYDLGLSVGLGMHEYERVLQQGDDKKQTPMLVVDITQQFFLSDRWALRFDIKNRYYTEKLMRFKPDTTGAQPETNDSTLATDAMIGLIFYFDHKDKDANK